MNEFIASRAIKEGVENQPYNNRFSVVKFFGSLTDKHAYVANTPSGWTSSGIGVSFIVKG